MPTIADNRAMWGDWYAWGDGGEEWSAAWGGSEAQWRWTILPRIERFLPTGRALEIAPGFGRFTHHLREHCARLVAVDLSEACVEACRERFAGDERVECHANDGRSLPMVEDGSVDFAFTFDSLVHAEEDVLEAYLHEFARVLAPEGTAFVHHSNLGEHRRYVRARRRLPRRVRERLIDAGMLDRLHRRAPSASAARVRRLCAGAGLRCSEQELVNWGGTRLIDCFSTIERASAGDPPARVVRNAAFMAQAEEVRRRAERESAPGGLSEP